MSISTDKWLQQESECDDYIHWRVVLQRRWLIKTHIENIQNVQLSFDELGVLEMIGSAVSRWSKLLPGPPKDNQAILIEELILLLYKKQNKPN